MGNTFEPAISSNRPARIRSPKECGLKPGDRVFLPNVQAINLSRAISLDYYREFDALIMAAFRSADTTEKALAVFDAFPEHVAALIPEMSTEEIRAAILRGETNSHSSPGSC